MSRYLPDFAGIFCIVVFLISLAVTGNDLFADGDTFWHIKVGTVMLEKHSLVDSDIFSHTAFGTPWTAHEWLSEIIMASIHEFAGLEGLLCFFLLVTALTFWVLFKITEKYANPWVTICCMSLALLFSSSHLAARPHLFTWLFMMIALAILTNGEKRLYWMPFIIAIWANLHGGFILGLVLQGIFIAGAVMDGCFAAKTPCREVLRTQKLPALVLLASFLAVGLNPFGYELLLFPFQVSKGVFSTLISEWKGPDLQSMWSLRFYLLALLLLVSFRNSSVTWTERLLIIFFVNAALTHMRHVSVMLLALTPFTTRMVNSHVGNWRFSRLSGGENQQLHCSVKTGPLLTAAIASAMIIASSINPQALAFLTPQKLFKVETGQLIQLTDFLETTLPDGKMFNEYTLGGYLLYALDPPPRVFVDGRADMYGEQILKDYDKIQASSSERESLLDKYDIDWIVFEKDSDLFRDLKRTGHWLTIFENDHYVVLTREQTGGRCTKEAG